MRVSPQRLAVGLIVLISVGFMISPVVLIARGGGPVGTAMLAVALVAFFVPHYLHVRAALRGAEPGGPGVALLVQAVAAYAPIPLLPDGLGALWWGAPTILLGSVLLRLRPPLALPVTVLMAVLQFVAAGAADPRGFDPLYALQGATTLFLTGFVIYCVVRLVVIGRELEQARMELAEAAVLRERLRISRDLHDGLGGSLAAIALKGDLARRLVERDPGAAEHELTELVHVARDAAQEVRQVARGYRTMSLTDEVQRAVALLEASGVSCQTNLAGLEVPRGVDEALAWAVREGTTNVVRHSRATTCSISTSAHGGTVRLELVNDGAPEPGADGGGLTGLRERAAGLGGSVSAERTGNGGFRLAVEVPA
ncbi:two-component system sensor histidine kinase DesK [Streptosporangium becharense]|uniref:Two-component system sensor histidine kinase DesK n=1 Tax=Streptosporangium becharense TaxID=1816182 RepID=A0A7W9ID56_9ACTN|nr:sensor histidine kinase [Streptosporangium becharense]MBB2911961.1 two-component system sensor histidine kinase DesK [Streptosporangium becharense]MBB5818508.1 two-component system sensor histidine kinase DesK [Streptosporangium becharense]